MRVRDKRKYLKGKKCLCCGSKKDLTIDHILPKAFGGTLKCGNRQPLCLNCNRKKGIFNINYYTKTFVIEPYMMGMSNRDRRELFENPYEVGCVLLNPTSELYHKYIKNV